MRLDIPDIRLTQLCPNSGRPDPDSVARLIAADLEHDGVRDVKWTGDSVRFGSVRWPRRDLHSLAGVGEGRATVLVDGSAVHLEVVFDTEWLSPSSVLPAVVFALPVLIAGGSEYFLQAAAAGIGCAVLLRVANSMIRLRHYFRRVLQRDIIDADARIA